VAIIIISFLICSSVLYYWRDTKSKLFWWQIKVDPAAFNIFDFWKDHVDRNIFTWSQLQMRYYNPNITFFDTQIKKYVKKGDKIVIWVYGKPVGIYALGEVIDEPFIGYLVSPESEYYLEGKNMNIKCMQIKIKYLKKMFNNPISDNVASLKKMITEELVLFRKMKTTLALKNIPFKPVRYFTDEILEYYHIGKVDAYSWIPIKPISDDIWDNILKLIESSNYH
jgi:hypothetical protein